jgi:hypothetical protein
MQGLDRPARGSKDRGRVPEAVSHAMSGDAGERIAGILAHCPWPPSGLANRSPDEPENRQPGRGFNDSQYPNAGCETSGEA